MQADFAIELGDDDETLDFPWVDSDGRLIYFDLKRHPELLSQLPEVRTFPELGDFLAGINSPKGILETAKCDAWASDEMNIEDQIFGAKWKFGSYVDLVFSAEVDRFSMETHESLVRRAVTLLKKVPEIPASIELLIRRCYFSTISQAQSSDERRSGFYITSYVFGYGVDGEQARRQWAVALKLSSNALLQITRERA